MKQRGIKAGFKVKNVNKSVIWMIVQGDRAMLKEAEILIHTGGFAPCPPALYQVHQASHPTQS